MRKSPFYWRILYGRANGLNAGFYIRKSPFMDGYYMAERMAQRPKLLHKKGSFYRRILHGRANGLEAALLCKKESFNGWIGQGDGLKADFYRKRSPFTDGYYMAERVAWWPTLQILYGWACCLMADTPVIIWLSVLLEGQHWMNMKMNGTYDSLHL